jgi:hypothetical protein
MVTFCVHWTTSTGARIECTDVHSGETEDDAKARVVAAAKRRAEVPGEEPVDGSLIWLERDVGALAGTVASVTCGPNWLTSWAAFKEACGL